MLAVLVSSEIARLIVLLIYGEKIIRIFLLSIFWIFMNDVVACNESQVLDISLSNMIVQTKIQKLLELEIDCP